MNIIDRFKNQRVSQGIHRKNRPRNSKYTRVENCFVLPSHRADVVRLHKKEGSERAHYRNLQSCGSVWVCPVCASIISERRRAGLQRGINVWRDKDDCNTVIMITITTPHHMFQSLDDVLKIQDKAIRIMKKQPQRGRYKVWRTIMDEMLSIGSYTGREVTFGENGWHPHRHELHFCVTAEPDQLRRWREEITTAFAIAFEKAGGVISKPDAFRKRAIRIDQVNDDDGYTRVSNYIVSVEGDSWTLAQEATKGVVKTAKNGNITPFGMLEAIRHGQGQKGLYSAKFHEYATTMKGKRQLFPTRGLNQFLGVEWKTDEELVKDDCISGELFYPLPGEEWRLIVRYQMRGLLLELSRGKTSFEFHDRLRGLLKWIMSADTG